MRKESILAFLSYSLIFISGILLLMANFAESPYMAIASIWILSVAILLYCLDNLAKRIGFALFMACMFTFQLAGIILPVLIGETDWKMGFDNYEYIMICNCLFISCITLVFTTAFMEKHTIVFGKKHGSGLSLFKDSSYVISNVQRWAFIICIISSIVAIAGEWQRMVYAIANGYMSMYGGYSTPAIVRRMQIVSRTSMFIGLAALPTKKRAWTYFALGLPVAIMTLIEGSRNGIVTYILFYIYFFYSYSEWGGQETGRAEDKKRKRKLFALIILIICIGTPLLYLYGYSRVDRIVEGDTGPLMLILSFFASQGGSAKLIGRAVQYKGQLPGICYSLGSIVDRVLGNSFEAYSVESALNGNSFGNIMTYLDSAYNYTVMHFGIGSSYIAEVYYDFGFIGLIIVNIIIGYIFNLMSSYRKISTLLKSFIFMLFYYMMMIPRGPLLTPIDNILSSSCLLTVFVVFFLSRRRSGIYGENKSSSIHTRVYDGRG